MNLTIIIYFVTEEIYSYYLEMYLSLHSELDQTHVNPSLNYLVASYKYNKREGFKKKITQKWTTPLKKMKKGSHKPPHSMYF